MMREPSKVLLRTNFTDSMNERRPSSQTEVLSEIHRTQYLRRALIKSRRKISKSMTRVSYMDVLRLALAAKSALA